MIYQEKKAYPTADELEEIFKVAVYNKAKPQTVVKQYVKKNIDAEVSPERIFIIYIQCLKFTAYSIHEY